MTTLAMSLGLAFVLAAGVEAQEPPQATTPAPPDDPAISVAVHSCTPNVGYYEAHYSLDGNGHRRVALFGLLLKTPDGTTRKGPAQIALPFQDGGRPSGEAYIVANGQIEQMSLNEFAGRYPTPCAFFGGVLT